MDEKVKKESASYKMNVDPEFKKVCDEFHKNLAFVTWEVLEFTYPQITKVLAKKIREAGLLKSK